MVGLDGKVALVTGAGRGIGRAIALRLAREGASVAVADLDADAARSVVKEAEALDRAGRSIGCDVTRADQVEAMIAKTVDDFGRLDILVNNAGILIIKPFQEMTEEEWDRIFAVNVKSIWLCTRVALPHLIRSAPGSKVINAASMAGKSPSRSGPLAAYTATKHAVVGLTRSLALELAPHRINVNAYCPGIVDTPMWDQIDSYLAAQQQVPPGTVKERAVDRVPLGRLETPEDVANLVAFLASPDSDYMTGQAINITGGMEVH